MESVENNLAVINWSITHRRCTNLIEIYAHFNGIQLQQICIGVCFNLHSGCVSLRQPALRFVRHTNGLVWLTFNSINQSIVEIHPLRIVWTIDVIRLSFLHNLHKQRSRDLSRIIFYRLIMQLSWTCFRFQQTYFRTNWENNWCLSRWRIEWQWNMKNVSEWFSETINIS